MSKNNFVTFELHTDQLEPHPNNPRKNLGDLTELTESIKKNGVLQNLTVVPIGTGSDEWTRFRVLIGHRRLAAAKAAGIDTLPCRVVEGLDDREQFSTMMTTGTRRMMTNEECLNEKMIHYKVELPLSDEAGTLFDRYTKHMREYVNDEGERPFENMTAAELFQTAMYMGSERMVREKLWEVLFVSHAITAEEYRERRLS